MLLWFRAFKLIIARSKVNIILSFSHRSSRNTQRYKNLFEENATRLNGIEPATAPDDYCFEDSAVIGSMIARTSEI